MRVAVISDQHIDESSRFDECRRVLAWIADDIRERGVDLVLLGGDLYERKSNPVERRAAADWITALADVAPVVAIRGNHDVVGDIEILGRLETRYPVIVEERAGMHVVAGVEVCCLSWPQAAHFKALAPDGDPSEALRAVLRGFGSAPRTGPRVLLAHAMVCGSKTSHGQPLVGHDMEIGLSDLDLAQADFVALGHIHMPQDWPLTGGGAVAYPGSPRRTSYGETEEKGYIVAELSTDWRPVTWERVPTPCAPMFLVEGSWTGGAMGVRCGDRVADPTAAEIRFRYTVAPDARDAARAYAATMRDAWVAGGAVSVKLEEEVIATCTARAPEIATAATLEAELRTLWTARKDTPPDERAARLVALANDLQEAA